MKNPFKKILFIASASAVLRFLVAFASIWVLGHPLLVAATCIALSLVTDFSFLRPAVKRLADISSFSEEHLTWLKDKQDVTPDEFRLFFSKLLSIRLTTFIGAVLVALLAWGVTGEVGAIGFGPILYATAFVVRFSRLQNKLRAPQRYRPSKVPFSPASTDRIDNTLRPGGAYPILGAADPLLGASAWHWWYEPKQ